MAKVGEEGIYEFTKKGGINDGRQSEGINRDRKDVGKGGCKKGGQRGPRLVRRTGDKAGALSPPQKVAHWGAP